MDTNFKESIMLKIFLPVITVFSGALLLSACATSSQDVQIVPEDRLTDECFIIRERMISNENNLNVPEQQGQSPTIEAQLLRQYEDRDCETVIEAARNKQKVVED
jgi:hypothetical protein